MSGVVDRIKEALLEHGSEPPTAALDTGALTARVAAMRRFLRAVDGHLPPTALAAARSVVDRAGERLELSREHTVVALAGTTGSGKSSMFNAIAGVRLSTVGVRRPTTGVAHACVWGADGTGPLLDWLGVPPNRRFDLEPEAGDGERLRGLVLLDLPDFDSVEQAHQLEVDRILNLVDQIVWVLDPQKYADAVVHERYLRSLTRYRDIMVIALNQVDVLEPADTVRCLADLRRLLEADGLAGVAVLPTSTVAPRGLGQLRTTLERTVTAHEAYLRRVDGDLTGVVDDLAPLVAVDAEEDRVDRATVRRLVESLSTVAGVPAVVEAVEAAYLHRAGGSTGWPIARWVRRLRPDPLRRLHLQTPRRRPVPDADTISGSDLVPLSVPTLPEATAAQRASAALAARELAEAAGRGLPEPWPAAVHAAARAREGDVPDALDVAVAGTDLGLGRKPVWWRAVSALHWLAALTALAGLGWLAARAVFFAIGLPELPGPEVGRLPLATVAFLGGLLFGLLLSVVVRPLVRWSAGRARRRAERRLRSVVAEVVSDLIVAPVRGVIRAYQEARTALRSAAPGRDLTR